MDGPGVQVRCWCYEVVVDMSVDLDVDVDEILMLLHMGD